MAATSRTLYQTLCVAVPKGLGGFVTIGLNGLLLTRMTPAEFGVYSICLLLVTLADGVLGAAIDMSAVKLASLHRLQDPRRAAAAEQWAAVFKIGLSLLLIGLLLPALPQLSQALFHRSDAALLLLAMTVAAAVLLMRSVFTHLQLRGRFAAYAGLELLAQSLRVAGIAAVLLWWQPSAWTLTLAALGGTGLAVLGGLGGLGIANLGLTPGRLRWSDGSELLHTLRWMLLTFALSSLYARLDILLLTQWSTIDQVGLFAAAQVFAFVPELFGMWLAVVFSPRVAPAQADATLRGLMLRVQSVVGAAAVSAGLLIGCVLTALPGSLPGKYAGAAELLMPLLLGALAGMVAMPVSVPFLMFAKPRFIVTFDLLSAPLLLLAYHLAIEHSGAVGAAWVSGCARLIKAAVLLASAWLWAHPARPEGLTQPL